ncbi:hypothetical protein Talka_02075 [Tepidimonas alkaliphilus]|uniref:Uncharacterized protein n=1 Tax=Tepidimonas alkaliphilus TaxID=2588942 RepID=A0A554W4R8_9BURK|nr:hypothetical protein [Tepidimonas alkaliphilus]TSE18578.1 hypothetical protein Talka_02075 [Tepidimonas alkaliphilus]
MLTLSSISVAPSPQQTSPVVRAQPLLPARAGQAAVREAVAPAQVAPQGDAARVQASAAPVRAPVLPAQEAQAADSQSNAAAPERAGLPPPTVAQGAVARALPENRDAAPRQADRGVFSGDPSRAAEASNAPASDPQRAARDGGVSSEDEAGFPPVKNPALEAWDTQIKELLPNLWKASRFAVDMVIGEEARQAAAERAQKLEELHRRLSARPLASLPPGEPQQSYGSVLKSAQSAPPAPRVDRLI